MTGIPTDIPALRQWCREQYGTDTPASTHWRYYKGCPDVDRHRVTSRMVITVIRSAQQRWARHKPWWNIAYMLAWGYELILGRVR
jgi:hypothetical protein